jgi:hypothetical protein
MPTTPAPGLPADWLNAWLAAIGITLLVPDTRLSWTTAPRPTAMFHHATADLPAQITEQLPTTTEIAALAIARHRPPDVEELSRKVHITAYTRRCDPARAIGDLSLGATVTDLGAAGSDTRQHTSMDLNDLKHSPLDPPVPQGRTLHDRIDACRRQLDVDPTAQIHATLAGTGNRVSGNGLGFDHTRFVNPADPIGGVWVDPVLELLASVGLLLLPARGDGTTASFRGWTGPPMREGAFTWPAWRPPLTCAGIDALLDRFWDHQHLGTTISRRYTSIPYKPRGSADSTRGYASRPVP